MIGKLIATLSLTLLAAGAAAQTNSPPGRLMAPQPQYQPQRLQPPSSSRLDELPADQLACLDDFLRRSGAPGIQEYIARGATVATSPVAELVKVCSLQAPKYARAYRSMLDFVKWFSTDVLNRTPFLQAFDKCRMVVSRYQSGLLDDFKARAVTLDSRQSQQQAMAMISELFESQQSTARIACLKLFIATLKVSGSGTGYFADELSLLEGDLRDDAFDLVQRSQAKLDDLTNDGLARFLSIFSFDNVPQSELGAEIEAASRQPQPAGYLSCYVTLEWASQFSSNSYCHRPGVEHTIAKAVAAIPLNNR